MRRFGIVITAAVLFSLLAAPAGALETYWQHDPATPGSWHDPANWDNGIPSSGDFAYIDNDGTAQISADAESYRLYTGYDNSGAVEQTGGIHTVSSDLRLGYYNYGSSGIYILSAGELFVNSEHIGFYGTGEFNQNGGTHTVGYLHVDDDSSYTLSGGTLSIGKGVEAYGSFHFTDGDGVLNVNGGLAHFEDAVIDGAGSASFASAVNSLTIFPTAFDPAAEFGSYNALGLVHNAGSTLVISAGEGFTGQGWIGDHVQNRGDIVASGGSLYFRGGLTISDGGTLDSGDYSLTVDNGATVTIAASGGELSAPTEYIGFNGTGEFNQDGGTHTVGNNLLLGYSPDSSGTYNLNAGELSVGSNEYIGGYYYWGTYTAEFNQDGGTHTVGNELYLGCFSASSGTYNLNAGELSVSSEYIGYDGTGEFNQTGGTHTVGYLYVNDDSSYTLSSGTLSTSDSAEVNGFFHFTNGDWALNINGGLANFEDAVIDGAGSASFTSAVNSLTIFPTGFDPAAQFGSYNALGLVHNAGSTLVISAGEGFAGRGWIGDHVQNRGNIVAGGGSIDFRGGLTISEGGTLDSGSYNFAVDNGATAAIAASGGAISARHEYIGYYGTGEFNQDGGTNTVSDYLSLGYKSGSGGTYNLNAGELSVGDEYIGGYFYSACTGEFNQTGGINTVGNDLCLGCSSDSIGTYNLSAGELSAGASEHIGYSKGTGEFNQTGGTNTINHYLTLGYNSGASGTYNLSGTGVLTVYQERIGNYGTGEFNQTGGTNTVSSDLYLSYESGASGTYNLSAGELSVGSSEYIGSEDGTGIFIQTGGINSVKDLHIDPASTYRLSSGMLSIKDGGSINGTVDFDHNAGILSLPVGSMDIQDATFINAGSASFETAANSLTILPAGFDPATVFGSTDIKGIVYTPGTQMIVDAGQSYTGHYDFDDPLEIRGTLIASGGMFGFVNSLTISNGGTFDTGTEILSLENGKTATIAASGGTLTALEVHIGYGSEGEFNQEGGTVTISGSLNLANNTPFIKGTYNLNNGTLATADLIVGNGLGQGELNQSGGALSVSGMLNMTANSSIYNLNGGSLEAHDLLLGGHGKLNITNNGVGVEISGSLTLQENAVFVAVPGTTIHMTGSDFENTSTSLNNLGKLQNTTFTFEDSSDTDTFEIACYDYGLIEANFYGNFGLEGLILDGSYYGTLQLVDAHVNFTGLGPSTQSEALYVRTLVLGENATLDLNGYNLYTLEYIDNGGTVLNGGIYAASKAIIPEPGTIALISAGLLGFAGLLRKKPR